jgi:hypothetical protein
MVQIGRAHWVRRGSPEHLARPHLAAAYEWLAELHEADRSRQLAEAERRGEAVCSLGRGRCT